MKKHMFTFTGIPKYKETDSIHSVKSSLKSHPALVALYKKYNFKGKQHESIVKTIVQEPL